MDGKTEGKRKKANKEKVSGKKSGGTGISSAAPVVGAVFGLLLKGVFSNGLTLQDNCRSLKSIPNTRVCMHS
jgi:hypothetical protein